jgi:hypothetical protein
MLGQQPAQPGQIPAAEDVAAFYFSLSLAQLANPYSRASASCAEDRMSRSEATRIRVTAPESPRWAARSRSLA